MLIHQTLHGYNNGHKLLAASVDISSKSKNILLKETDSPSPTFHEKKNTCYTGYPLIEDKFYVISKTWTANELNRPGCVWTHSLLIPLSSFKNNFFSIDRIIEYFINEVTVEVVNSCSIPLQFNCDINTNHFKDLSWETSYIVLNKKQSLLDHNSYSIEDVIKMWSVLLPKARFNFTFKTWAPKLKPSDSIYTHYDLLLCDNNNSNFKKVDNWAINLYSEDNIELKEFLNKYGRDLDKEKINTYYLNKIYSLLNNNHLDELSLFILKWKKTPITLVKNIISMISIDNISLYTSYLISSYILIIKDNEISSKLLGKIGNILLENDYNFLIKIINEETSHTRNLSINLIDKLPRDLLLSLYKKNIYSTLDILKPDVINDKIFWSQCDYDFELLSIVVSNADLIKHLPIDLISPKLASFENAYKPYFYDLVINNYNSSMEDWNYYILDNQDEFIHYLSKHKTTINRELSYYILSNFNYSSLILCTDELLTSMYESIFIDDDILWKIINLVTISKDKLFPELFKKSFDELCYYFSKEDISFKKSKKIRDNMMEWSNDTKYFPFSMRKAFLFFSINYANQASILLSDLSQYEDNLYFLKKYSQ